jgi:hypothetical protein
MLIPEPFYPLQLGSSHWSMIRDDQAGPFGLLWLCLRVEKPSCRENENGSE